MNVLGIGGTGHIGSPLVPCPARSGHRVAVAARQATPRYACPVLDGSLVGRIVSDRRQEEESHGCLDRMQAIDTDIAIDLICFTLEHRQING